MIAIEINGMFLDLPEDLSIRLEKNYSTVIDSIYQGDYSFPFDIVTTDTNLRVLGFLNVLEFPNKVLQYDCYLHLYGIPYQKAKFIVKLSTQNTFKVNIAGGLKSLKTAELSLREIEYGDDYNLGQLPSQIALAATDISRESDWTVYGFTFVPHKNDAFYGTNNSDFNGVLNAVNPNNGIIHYNDTSTGNKYAIVPWFFLFFVLKKIFDQEGYTPMGTFWNHPEAKKILLYNNRALDSLREIGSTKVMINSNATINCGTNSALSLYNCLVPFPAIKGPVGTYDDAMAYTNANYKYEIKTAGQYTIELFHLGTLHQPYSGYWAYVNGVEIWHYWKILDTEIPATGRTYTFNWTANVGDIGKILEIKTGNFINPNGSLAVTLLQGSTITINQQNVDEINFFTPIVSAAKHMKDMTVSELLVALKKEGVDITFDDNNKTVILDFLEDMITNNAAEDWTEKCTSEFELDLDNYNKGYNVSYDFGTNDKLTEGNFIKPTSPITDEFNSENDLPNTNLSGSIVYVKNTNQLLIRKFDSFANTYSWAKYSDRYYNEVFAAGENKINLTMAPMLMGIGNNVDPGANADLQKALMPVSSNLGSSDMFGMGDNDFDLRICFYRGQNQIGMAPNNKGGNYILASSMRHSLNGFEVGSFDLSLHSLWSLFVRFSKNTYYRIANGQILERDVRLNEIDTLTLNKKSKVSIDGVIFLIKSVSIVISSKFQLARAKFLKL